MKIRRVVLDNVVKEFLEENVRRATDHRENSKVLLGSNHVAQSSATAWW
jgi:hypothetical protein